MSQAAKIHVRRVGHGSPMVLLHGWGFDGRIFDAWLPALTAQHAVHVVDLPGFGLSDAQPDLMCVEAVAHVLAPHMPRDAAYVGWSLGGVVASALAALPALQAKALCTLATTPCCLAQRDWPGMSHDVWSAFQAQLRDAPERLWRRFLRMAVTSSGLRGEVRRCFKTPSATGDVLQQALHWLAQDIRFLWGALPCPHQGYLGADDALVSVDWVNHYPETVRILPGGHDFAWCCVRCEPYQHFHQAFTNTLKPPLVAQHIASMQCDGF